MYKKEINVFQIIRMRRYLMRALKELLPRQKRKELRQHTKYSQILTELDGTFALKRSSTVRGEQGVEHEMYDSFFNSTEAEEAAFDNSKDEVPYPHAQ